MSKQKQFYSAMQTGLQELGVLEGDTFKGSYPQMLSTKYGKLLIKVTKDKSKVYTCFTRFEDVDKAKELHNCNPFSGKWNFHYFVKDNAPEEIADHILNKIKNIV